MGKSGGTSCPNDDKVIGQCNLVTERDVTERNCQSLPQKYLVIRDIFRNFARRIIYLGKYVL
ncbi:MAG: hypothetical protein J6J29_00880 [Paludibacteraceae bacterium]|nr:hypothetical protein [Paludibacteraceae bacterium]